MRLAAGVVVRRRRDGAVLLGRRTERARSWAGTIAFPGGSVDDDDHLLPLLSGAAGREAAFRGAALREALEEAGLVSVANADGTACDDVKMSMLMERVRAGTSLRAALSELSLALDDRHLLPLGAWPTAENTFLVARYLWPVDDEPVRAEPPTHELDEISLHNPVATTQGWRDGSVFLPPPMRIQLLRLAACAHIDDDETVAAALRVVPTEAERQRRDVIDGVVFIDTRTPTLLPATTTNCLVLGCGDVLLVDPATPYDDERARFDAVLGTVLEGRRVAGIFLTHHHHDHIGDAERLRELHGCPIYAHALTAERIDVPVDVVIDDGYVFELAADDPARTLRFVAVHTPGHAPGHLCLFERERRLLVAGDMVAGVGSIIIDPPEGHMSTYLASLDRLMAMEPRALIPAHGGLLTNAVGRLAQQKAHRLAREAAVLAAIAAGADNVDRVVSSVYGADTPTPMLAFAARSVLAIVERLVELGAVTDVRGLHLRP
jgi:ribonuclease/clavin/mitogillin